MVRRPGGGLEVRGVKSLRYRNLPTTSTKGACVVVVARRWSTATLSLHSGCQHPLPSLREVNHCRQVALERVIVVGAVCAWAGVSIGGSTGDDADGGDGDSLEDVEPQRSSLAAS